MNAVDTNVLIYARDPREPSKQQTADALIRSLADGVLLWQVACEYVAASRKLAPFGFTRAQALADVADMRLAWRAVRPTWAVMDGAAVLHAKYSLSFWDALLIAACLEAGVARLYTEDFDKAVEAEGIEIVNPFVTS